MSACAKATDSTGLPYARSCTRRAHSITSRVVAFGSSPRSATRLSSAGEISRASSTVVLAPCSGSLSMRATANISSAADRWGGRPGPPPVPLLNRPVAARL